MRHMKPMRDRNETKPKAAPADVSPKAGPARRSPGAAGKGAASVRETGGPRGPEPTRYGDWESKGRCVDF